MIKNFLVHHLNHFNIRWENALCGVTESHYFYKFLRCHFYSSAFQSNNHFSSHVMLHLFKQLTKTMGHYFLNLNVVLLKSLNLGCVARFGTFAQFKKCEKHPWRSVTVSPPWVFYMFFKLYKWYQIAQCITFNFWFHFRKKQYHRCMTGC